MSQEQPRQKEKSSPSEYKHRSFRRDLKHFCNRYLLASLLTLFVPEAVSAQEVDFEYFWNKLKGAHDTSVQIDSILSSLPDLGRNRDIRRNYALYKPALDSLLANVPVNAMEEFFESKGVELKASALRDYRVLPYHDPGGRNLASTNSGLRLIFFNTDIHEDDKNPESVADILMHEFAHALDVKDLDNFSQALSEGCAEYARWQYKVCRADQLFGEHEKNERNAWLEKFPAAYPCETLIVALQSKLEGRDIVQEYFEDSDKVKDIFKVYLENDAYSKAKDILTKRIRDRGKALDTMELFEVLRVMVQEYGFDNVWSAWIDLKECDKLGCAITTLGRLRGGKDLLWLDSIEHQNMASGYKIGQDYCLALSRSGRMYTFVYRKKGFSALTEVTHFIGVEKALNTNDVVCPLKPACVIEDSNGILLPALQDIMR